SRVRYQRGGNCPATTSPRAAARATPAAGSVRSKATRTRAIASAASFQRGSRRRRGDSGAGSCASARVISGVRRQESGGRGQRPALFLRLVIPNLRRNEGRVTALVPTPDL